MKPLIRPADVMRDIDLQLGRQIVRYERQAASDSGGAAQATSLYIIFYCLTRNLSPDCTYFK